jgi:RNA polymerase sigma-70 factor (ECF subfamily)
MYESVPPAMPIPYDEFAALVLAELDSVHRVARSLARDAAEADDLVQETFLKAVQGHASFEPRGFGLRPWLLRILHNTFLNRREKEAKRTGVDVHALDVAAPEAAAEPPATIDDIDWADYDGRIGRALERLPSALRATMLLWAIEGLSYQEMAQVMDVPIGTVMSRLFRARAQLRDQLAPVAQERGLKAHPGAADSAL